MGNQGSRRPVDAGRFSCPLLGVGRALIASRGVGQPCQEEAVMDHDDRLERYRSDIERLLRFVTEEGGSGGTIGPNGLQLGIPNWSERTKDQRPSERVQTSGYPLGYAKSQWHLRNRLLARLRQRTPHPSDEEEVGNSPVHEAVARALDWERLLGSFNVDNHCDRDHFPLDVVDRVADHLIAWLDWQGFIILPKKTHGEDAPLPEVERQVPNIFDNEKGMVMLFSARGDQEPIVRAHEASGDDESRAGTGTPDVPPAGRADDGTAREECLAGMVKGNEMDHIDEQMTEGEEEQDEDEEELGEVEDGVRVTCPDCGGGGCSFCGDTGLALAPSESSERCPVCAEVGMDGCEVCEDGWVEGAEDALVEAVLWDYQNSGTMWDGADESLVFGKLHHSNGLFPGADLKGEDLSGVDLGFADLSGANLAGADLSACGVGKRHNAPYGKAPAPDLNGADLTEANLSRAELSGATLTRATMVGTICTGADFSGGDLRGAILTGANIEAVGSLRGTRMAHVIGLTAVQRVACRAKGAVFEDEDADADARWPSGCSGDNETVACSYCDGQGVVGGPGAASQCPACDGIGERDAAEAVAFDLDEF